ncbi:TonB family protein [Stenotrophomonas sp. SY1]|uniref:TonB family protein n=1 Tax=Stenotrophomonas sp. SY1 TaxID=477235 RepID=UPI001E6485E1|nr:TonB family protein [Stenotrophomonas sp. SY1]MCD9086107.1 TonB family protein [Stenotrophomonas sp. SY1]
MNSTEFLAALFETTLASSVAVLLVLLLRRPVRKRLGASAAYLLWLLLPVAMLAVLLPAPRVAPVPMVVSGAVTRLGEMSAVTTTSALHWSLWLILVWLLGALLMAVVLFGQQRRFLRGLGELVPCGDGCWQAQVVAGLPAAMGLLRPRIVLPEDFEQRYTAREQELVLLHERLHLRRGDIAVNAMLALLHCVYWFNPLLLIALRRCREDQELSCDERVVARAAGDRRCYGQAMLKTGLASFPLPVGCHWQNNHPLKERIEMLKRPVPGRKQWVLMLMLATVLSSGLGYAAWAAQPVRQESSAEGELYATFVQATADGSQQRFELRQAAGMPFAFKLRSGKGVEWEAEFIVEPADSGLLRLKGSLKADGALVSSPTLLVEADKPAGIEVSTSDGRSLLALELRSSSLAARAPVAAGRITAEPESGDSMPITERMSPPTYPKEAFAQGITGKVLLYIDVDAQGKVADVRVGESQPLGVFDAAAVAAARQWVFTPAQRDGKAVAGRIQVPVQFDLDESAAQADPGNGG